MKKRFFAFILSFLLVGIFAPACAESDYFNQGVSLLKEGKYKSVFSESAIDNFRKAHSNNPKLGNQIAQILLAYSKALAEKNEYLSITTEDAHSVLEDALKFDGSIKDEVVEYHLQYLATLLNKKNLYARSYCRYLRDYNAGNEAYKLVLAYENEIATNSEISDYIGVYECLSRTLEDAPDNKDALITAALKRAVTIFDSRGIADSFTFSKSVCEIFGDEKCIIRAVDTYRKIANDRFGNGDIKGAVKIYDEIRHNFSDYLTEEDKSKFTNGIYTILSNYDGEFLDLYDNFKFVLLLHYYDGLSFYFSSEDFDIDESLKVFDELREPEETSYFYFDTGRFISNSRGLLLTDETLYYHNFSEDTHAIALDDISAITLSYEKGLSLTGWKLRFNEDESTDLRLSRIDDEALIPFIASLIYFINLNNDQKEISLFIPENEREILNGSIWERHKGVIVSAAVVTAVAVTYAIAKDNAQVTANQTKILVGNALSAVKTTTASTKNYVHAKMKYAPNSLKASTQGAIKSFKTFVFNTKNGEEITGKLKDYYDRRKIVKMPFVGHRAAETKPTARGYKRDSKLFWKTYQDKWGDDLSKNNQERIANGKSPIVDNKWVESYPNHKDFMGDTLDHHHLNHGGKAIPLPVTIHRLSDNKKNWHAEGLKE